MSKKLKNNLVRIIIAILLFVAVFSVDLTIGLDFVIQNYKINWIFPLGLYLIIYFIIGYDVLIKAIKNITRGQIFDENFLMCIATIGAFCIKEFPEAVAVLLFYQIGEWFQSYAVNKSRKSIAELMDIRPDYANLLKENNTIEQVKPEQVKTGSIIVVKPGEKIPLDGVIIKGISTLDTKALTGESLPREVKEGNEVISGTINLTSTIQVRVEKEYYDSTVSKILELVENASSKKSSSEKFVSKFAKFYTPIVVIGAVLLFVLGGVISSRWTAWLVRALNFLVISCPCALVISVPLSFFSGIGVASKNGILIKGSSYLENFNKVNIFVFDKTGTLTKGNFVITQINSTTTDEELLKYAAIAEKNSSHPIATSIIQYYGKEIPNDYELINVSGKGIIAKGKKIILCGNEKLMNEYNIKYVKPTAVGTIVYVAVNNEFLGSIVIADEIKENAKDMITSLNNIGAKTIMLTGDNEIIASHIAKELGIKEYKYSLLPQNKVEEVDKLLREKPENKKLCFVGDGINDAPVLMRADVGVSMGNIGSDAAIEASDIVLMHDDLKCLAKAKKIAKKTLAIVKQNIIFTISIKLIVLILSVFGIANIWLAIMSDVGVSVLAILNSMRVMGKY